MGCEFQLLNFLLLIFYFFTLEIVERLVFVPDAGGGLGQHRVDVVDRGHLDEDDLNGDDDDDSDDGDGDGGGDDGDGGRCGLPSSCFGRNRSGFQKFTMHLGFGLMTFPRSQYLDFLDHQDEKYDETEELGWFAGMLVCAAA